MGKEQEGRGLLRCVQWFEATAQVDRLKAFSALLAKKGLQPEYLSRQDSREKMACYPIENTESSKD